MARMSLWTPLLVIFTIQLVILLYLNLRTSKTSDGDLVSLHVSPFDRVVKGGSRNEGKAGPGAALLGMVQIGAPASEISRERRNNGAKWVKSREAAEGFDPNNIQERKVERENLSGLVRRNEVHKRSDDEQLSVGERERAMNARGDRKLAVHQSFEEADVENGGVYGKKVEDNGLPEVINIDPDQDSRRNEMDPKNDNNNGRRKINQVTLLKSHDSNNPAPVGGAREPEKMIKKPSINEKKDKKDDIGHAGKLTHNDFLKHMKSKGYALKEGINSPSKNRPLIDKVGQLRMAGTGRLKDMPFMQARRASQESLNDRAGGKIPPSSKFNYKKIEDLNKYADKINYFDEFCKEVSEPLVECSERKAKELSEEEEAGKNIMFTIRTTFDYHDTRLPILFETWLSTVDPRTVFLVTDGQDSELDDITENIGMHYINAQSGTTHSRTDLCCKAGVELELMLFEENSAYDWLCHVDDDIYVNLDTLTKTLSKFDPRNEPIYFGRSGSPYHTPRTVKAESLLGKPGQAYHFAVGGMYCLSRRMLEMVNDYLVGCDAFSESCKKTQEPEDVTVGLVVGAVLDERLSRTEMIYTHGVDLMSFVPSPYLDQQLAFAYGYGSLKSWHFTPNLVYVPGALYNPDEDTTQFKSIHCHLFPSLQWCIDKKKQLAVVLEDMKKPDGKEKRTCVCTWKTVMCCDAWKEAYRKAAEHNMKERMMKKGLAIDKLKDVAKNGRQQDRRIVIP